MSKPAFVIGDVHGHVDRLEALLAEADVANRDCLVIQLGDLAHVGYDTQTRDVEAWRLASKGAVDTVIWGNHDRAVVDPHHVFGGYSEPRPELRHIIKTMEAEGRLLMALEVHGWLLTHAGLHPLAADQLHADISDPKAIADRLNELAAPENRTAMIDAVCYLRGGASGYGGVLWRDIREPLYTGVPQVFGHSADRDHLIQGEKDKWYCVDIGGKGGHADPEANTLAGIWLPSQEIVRVDLY